MAHARIFGASNAGRWLNCLAAPGREEGRPNNSSEFAREGTAAHELGATCLADRKLRPEHFLGHVYDIEGHKVEVTDDMVEHVTSYVDFIWHLVDTTNGQLFVEVRVDYRQWLPAGIGTDDGFGTSDVIIITEDELITADLKYGMGEKVDAKDNDQLRLYSLGAYAEHGILNDFKRARNIIIQPRKGGVSEWTYELDELLAFGEYVKGRAQLVIDGCDVGTPGDKQCRFCKAKANCPELQALVLDTVFADFENMETKVADLVECYKRLDIIEGWSRAVKERMYEETLAGSLPDYKLVEGRKGNRAWVDAEVAEAALKAMRLKQDQMYTLKLVGPAAIEKALKDKPRSWKKVTGLITQPTGKLTIAHISDPRKAVGKPADDFESIPADADLF